MKLKVLLTLALSFQVLRAAKTAVLYQVSPALQCDGTHSSNGLLRIFNSGLFCSEVKLIAECVKSILPQLPTRIAKGEELGSSNL